MNAITPAKPVIKTSELTWLPLEYLLFNLNPIDKADLFGQVATENVLEIAGQIMHATNSGNGLGWVISRTGGLLPRLVSFRSTRVAGASGAWAWIISTWR